MFPHKTEDETKNETILNEKMKRLMNICNQISSQKTKKHNTTKT